VDCGPSTHKRAVSISSIVIFTGKSDWSSMTDRWVFFLPDLSRLGSMRRALYSIYPMA